MSIDSNPTRAQFDAQVLPFLQGCESVLGHARTGVYCNAPTIDRALAAGVGAYFWQHDWGSAGRIHDAAHLHQRAIDTDKVDGIGIDLNTIRKNYYGQWSAHEHTSVSSGGAGVTQQAAGAEGARPEQILDGVSQSAGDPGALFGGADHLIGRVTGLADRAIGLAGRLAGRIG
ncbi:hypothetical protein GCM10023353_16930 [Tomitella cavernea]|uniref:Rv2525c-like glycoside hydrolase-like domain-containing protein n=2 Tax=Tomitella cavernea TaxID=1387982 RepID=A0ABP9CMU3_9ACTN